MRVYPGDVRLLTVLVHFGTAEAYHQIGAQKGRELRNWLMENLGLDPDDIASLDADQMARHDSFVKERSWRPPHRFNDIAAFVEVIYDGGSTIKSYDYLAVWRKRPLEAPMIAPRRSLENKVFRLDGKCSEVWLEREASALSSDDYQAALIRTGTQLRNWAKSQGWALEFDDQLVACTDWKSYVEGARRAN